MILPNVNEIKNIVSQLYDLNYFRGAPTGQLDELMTNCIARRTVLVDEVPRIFRLDIEDNYESYGEDIVNAVNNRLHLCGWPGQLRLVIPPPASQSWENYVTYAGRLINDELASLAILERLYLTGEYEKIWGGLLTCQMADQIKLTSGYDTDAATLCLP